MLNKPNLKENIRIFIVHRGSGNSFCWAVCLCFLLPTLVDNTYALLPSCLTENKFVLDRDLLDQFVILDFPRTHPNAIIEVASKVLFAGGKNPVEGETICADIEELKQIAAAMGISIARSRVMEMIRKANLVRAERIAQKRISLSSHVYEEALRLDPSHWSLLVLLGNSQLSEGRTKDAVQNLEIAIGGLENDCCESCEASRVQELNRARYLYLIAISLQHNTEMTNAQTDEFYKSLTHHSKNLLSHEVESDAVWYLLGKLFSRLSRWNGSRKVVFAEVSILRCILSFIYFAGLHEHCNAVVPRKISLEDHHGERQPADFDQRASLGCSILGHGFLDTQISTMAAVADQGMETGRSQ
mmetsp:Transcript_23758/g.77354  ORF Transcript_23758/g.77354 Transcript_23758/m.77354 type:complete len:357 (-) Transcript_23758:1260-2330(-)